ncbi:Alanine--tRNA ligase [Chlorella vulgaris]
MSLIGRPVLSIQHRVLALSQRRPLRKLTMATQAGELEWPVARVRSTFVEFFQSKGHTPVLSSPVVPVNDPTLLFSNAGMNQFKPIFLGTVDPASDFAKLKRASNSQKCIRAGGKHNDLDDVGKDNYHHTFFEMLGNWSFGDYFKKEAITWAWELLTEVYKLPSERLYATYFGGDESQGLPPDEDARQIWLQFLPEDRVLPFGCKDNFWEMGDQGPCGPCTEIHFDRIGGRHVPELVNMDDPNVLEIWNLVFIQFNREADGQLKNLPAKHVDTGAGLERVTSILQGQMSNYATDVFGPIFEAIQKATGHPEPYTDRLGEEDANNKDMAYRVVADHIRTLCFAIADGARPGNEGREYVLRRVLRRAVRYGREVLGAKEGFFSSLVDVVVEHMGPAYPELVKAQANIREIIKDEETTFSRTLVKGLEQFHKMAGNAVKGQLAGADAFMLWDTFGFPVDLTELMAQEAGLHVDMAGFQAAMEEAKEKSRAGAKQGAAAELKFQAEETAYLQNSGTPLTDDGPKYGSADVATKVLAILSKDGYVQSTSDVAPGAAVGLNAIVAAGYVLHMGRRPEAELKVGDSVTAKVDYTRRGKIMPNHTYTHVLNYALRKVLGDHVEQKGSIVLPDKLRFDFSNNGVVDSAKLAQVDSICQQFLAEPLQVYTKEVPLAQAKAINGLRAVFGEVYPDPVRVVSVGRSVDELVAAPDDEANMGLSIEFCGGTHLANTKEAGAFALLTEEGISKGVRRIVAVTGDEAEAAIALADQLAEQVAAASKLAPAEMAAEVKALSQSVSGAVIPTVRKSALTESLQGLTRQIMEEQKKAAAANKERAVTAALEAADAAAAAGGKFLVARLEVGLDTKAVQEACKAIQKKHPALPVLFVSAGADKALAIAGVPKDLAKQLSAGDWVKEVVGTLGGRGGGNPTMAQGTGPEVGKVDEALDVASSFASLKLTSMGALCREAAALTLHQAYGVTAAVMLVGGLWLFVAGKRLAPGAARLVAAAPVVVANVLLPLALFCRWEECTSLLLISFNCSWIAAFKALSWAVDRGALCMQPGGFPLSQFLAVYVSPITPAVTDAAPSGKAGSMPRRGSQGRLTEDAGGPVWLIAVFLAKHFELPGLIESFVCGLSLYALLSLIMDGPAALFVGLTGLRVSPHFDQPWLSTSVATFWSKRWDLAAGNTLRQLVFDCIVDGSLLPPPPPKRRSPAAGHHSHLRCQRFDSRSDILVPMIVGERLVLAALKARGILVPDWLRMAATYLLILGSGQYLFFVPVKQHGVTACIVANTRQAAVATLTRLGIPRTRPGLRRAVAAVLALAVNAALPKLFCRWQDTTTIVLLSFNVMWLSSFKALSWAVGRGALCTHTFTPAQFAATYVFPITPSAAEAGLFEAPALASLAAGASSEAVNDNSALPQTPVASGTAASVHAPEASPGTPAELRGGTGRLGDDAGSWAGMLAAWLAKAAMIAVLVWLLLQPLPGLLESFLLGLSLYALLSLIMDGPAALFIGLTGLRVSPHFDQPWLSISVATFWSKRWDLAAGNTLRQLVFDCIVDGSLLPPPVGTPPSRPSAARQLLATALSFATSGLVHEYLTGKTTGGVWLAFFLLQVPVIVSERLLLAVLNRRGILLPSWLRASTTCMLIVGTAQHLFWAPAKQCGVIDSVVLNVYGGVLSLLKQARLLAS